MLNFKMITSIIQLRHGYTNKSDSNNTVEQDDKFIIQILEKRFLTVILSIKLAMYWLLNIMINFILLVLNFGLVIALFY